MFIKQLKIKNFRMFPANAWFEVDNINVPNGEEGSGLSVFVGENGCGKTSLIEAFALPILPYKADSFSINDFYDIKEETQIEIYSASNFAFAGTMPKAEYKGQGFSFEAAVRSRDNKAYLSSIVVSDQKFIKADGEDKPREGSPDLRVAVNNPFKGSRFTENDVLFLDRSRLYQSRSGTYNTTRFDRLMDDFNFQYLKAHSNDIPDLNNANFEETRQGISNEFLDKAFKKFKEISGSEINLDFIENTRPFENAFFAEKKSNNQQIVLNMLGSGYEMIFSLLYSYYLSEQSGKQLIVLIDEPELHLHPSLQEVFVKFILEISQKSQIILTSHSPLFVKQLLYNNNVVIDIMKRSQGGVEILPIEKRLLSYLSANEVNYLAFELATEEYHNELFEELKYAKGANKDIKPFDNDFFIGEKGEPKDSPWKGNPNEVSVHTFIRNQIHHRKDNGAPDLVSLKLSIQKMRSFLDEILAG